MRILKLAILLLLFLPFLLWWDGLKNIDQVFSEELASAILRTSLQAFVSAVLSLAFGLIGAMGLASISSRKFLRFSEILFLLPNFMPPLFLLVSVLSLWTHFLTFPYGFWGVVIFHALINMGLVSVFLYRSWSSRFGELMELSYVEACSRWRFLTKVIWPLGRSELSFLFLFVFSICFTSFAIPLIVGSGGGETLEVLIFEKLSLGRDLKGAFAIALVQSLFILLFSFLIRPSFTNLKSSQSSLPLLSWSFGFYPVALASVLSFAGLLLFSLEGFHQAQALNLFGSEFRQALLWSLAVGLGVGLLLLLLFALWLASGKLQIEDRLLLGYVAPSAALVGFVILFLSPQASELGQYLKLIFGLGLILFPALFRLSGLRLLEDLQRQVQVAEVFGANSIFIFRQVIWPQVMGPVCRLAGLGAFWACGDFTYSAIVTESDFTLALQIKSLLSFYRLEAALLLIWPLFAVGVLCYSFFGGLAYVFSAPFSSRHR